jgi:hypothetical protein
MTIYIIYEIRPLDKNIIYSYVGSSMNYRNRKYQHKKDCNDVNRKPYNYKLYQFIRDNGGFEKFEFIPLEEYECETKTQSRIREQLWIDKIENKLNMVRAYTSTEETKEQNKIYRENNKTNMKEYNEKNKEHIKKIKKIYYENNEEKDKERSKKYRENNEEKIKQQKKEKYTCCCGVISVRNHFRRHERSIFHLNYLEQLNKIETECIECLPITI